MTKTQHPSDQTRKGTSPANFVARLSKEDAIKHANMFLVLRNQTRLRIVDVLREHGGYIWVAKIGEVLEVHPAVISNHLALLRSAGLIECEKKGKYAYYTLKQDAFNWYRQYIDQLTLVTEG